MIYMKGNSDTTLERQPLSTYIHTLQGLTWGEISGLDWVRNLFNMANIAMLEMIFPYYGLLLGSHLSTIEEKV